MQRAGRNVFLERDAARAAIPRGSLEVVLPGLHLLDLILPADSWAPGAIPANEL